MLAAVRIGWAANDLQSARDNLQQVVEIMCYAARKLADRFYLLSLMKSIFHRATMRHIADNAGYALWGPVDEEGAAADVNPTDLISRAAVHSRLHVDRSRYFGLGECFADRRLIFANDVLESCMQVPEGLHV